MIVSRIDESVKARTGLSEREPALAGTAQVFHSEEEALEKILDGTVTDKF